jgi:YfiH family protein
MPRWFLSNTPGYIRAAQDPGDAFTPVAAFTTRTGGLSATPFDSLNLSEGVGDDTQAVRANRARVLGALGLDPAHVAYATQVHGATCLVPPGPGWAGTADALATRHDGLVLAVGSADCLAVLLWDSTRPAIAAAHAGWRGTLAGVVPRAVSALTALGSDARDLRAALGPRIGACCFEVSADVAERFPAEDRRESGPRITIDLAGAVTRQLQSAGLAAASIRDLGRDLEGGACTAGDAANYFSHRRDQGRTGRSWGIVSARPAAPAQAHERAV